MENRQFDTISINLSEYFHEGILENDLDDNEYEYIFNIKEISDKLIEIYENNKTIFPNSYTIDNTSLVEENIRAHINTAHNLYLYITPKQNRHGRSFGLENIIHISIIIILFNIPVDNNRILHEYDENFILTMMSYYNLYLAERRAERKAERKKPIDKKHSCIISNKYLKYKIKYLKYKNKYLDLVKSGN